jgi:hypothetical protein
LTGACARVLPLLSQATRAHRRSDAVHLVRRDVDYLEWHVLSRSRHDLRSGQVRVRQHERRERVSGNADPAANTAANIRSNCASVSGVGVVVVVFMCAHSPCLR